MEEETKEFNVSITSADIQEVMKENPIVALQVTVKAQQRVINGYIRENERLRSELGLISRVEAQEEAIY
jgi:ribosomal protein L19E